MRKFLTTAALAVMLAAPGVARADDAQDRSQAIQLCRAEVTAQAVGADTVRLDQTRVRSRVVRVDFDVWRNGRLQNVRCDVARGGENGLRIAAVTPALTTASAAN